MNTVVNPPILERKRERETLHAAIRDATAGRGGSVVIVGEPGIGKTTLLDDAATAAAGAPVLTSRCTPLGRDLPFGVLHQLFGGLARRSAPGGRPFDGQGALLHALLVDGTAPADLGAITQSTQWVVSSVAEAEGLVLSVDDLHWADTASLTVLGHICALLPGIRAALIGATRDAPADGHPPELASLLAGTRLLRPQPLSEEAISRLAPDHAVEAPMLRRLTGGVPFYVSEVIAHAAGSNELAGSAHIVASIRGRLRRVGEPGHAAAEALAILADQGTNPLVANIADIDPPQLDGALAALAAEGILDASSPPRLAHPIVGEAVLAGMTDARRRAMHDRATTALQEAGRPQHIVAAHALRGTPTGKEERVRMLVAAGRAAGRSGSHREAATYLEQATSELRADDASRTELLGELAAEFRAAGDPSAAATALTERLSALGDAAERASCRVALGDARFAAGDFGGAERSYAEGLTELLDSGAAPGSPAVRGLVARAASAQLTVTPTLSAATRRMVDDVVRQRVPDTAEDCMLLAAAAVGYTMLPDDAAPAPPRSLAARAYAGWPTDAIGLADDPTSYLLSGALNMSGLFTEGVALLTNAVIDARRSGHALSEATALYCRGAMHHSAGDVRQAVPDLSAAVDAVRLGWSHYREAAEVMLLRCHLAMGDRTAARTVARGADSSPASPLVSSVQLVGRSVWATADGDPVTGLELARSAGRALPAGMESTFLAWREPAVDALLRLGQPREARAIAEEELTVVAAGGDLPGPRAHALIRLARSSADPEEALVLAHEAVALVAGSRRLIAMRAREHIAERLIELRRTDEAHQHLLAVLRQARDHALAPTEGRALAALAAIGCPAPPSTPAMRLASLSPAELRVVELAAEGLTNRQIATRLFVTLKTVEFHLSRCFRKLAVTKRGELADALSAAQHVA